MSLTSRSNVKAFKNVSGTAHDSEIDRLILAVDKFINQYCNRTIEQATVTEYHSLRAGQAVFLLKNPPVASITSLYDDPERSYGSGTLLTNNTDYVLEDEDAGIVRFDEWATSGGIRNIKVVYVGGFSSVPADLAQAAIELVWLARDKGDKALLGLQSKSIADGSVSVFRNDWPAGVKEILDRYVLSRI